MSKRNGLGETVVSVDWDVFRQELENVDLDEELPSDEDDEETNNNNVKPGKREV
jgi:hypothetical protein